MTKSSFITVALAEGRLTKAEVWPSRDAALTSLLGADWESRAVGKAFVGRGPGITEVVTDGGGDT